MSAGQIRNRKMSIRVTMQPRGQFATPSPPANRRPPPWPEIKSPTALHEFAEIRTRRGPRHFGGANVLDDPILEICPTAGDGQQRHCGHDQNLLHFILGRYWVSDDKQLHRTSLSRSSEDVGNNRKQNRPVQGTDELPGNPSNGNPFANPGASGGIISGGNAGI